MSPNALDRTAAWLLTMNAQLLEDEGLGPDPPHRDRLRSKEDLSQAEKVNRSLELGAGRAALGDSQLAGTLRPNGALVPGTLTHTPQRAAERAEKGERQTELA